MILGQIGVIINSNRASLFENSLVLEVVRMQVNEKCLKYQKENGGRVGGWGTAILYNCFGGLKLLG